MDLCKVQTIVDWATLFLFEMSNVFLNLLTFIDVSLPAILQYWPLLLSWLGRINPFFEELKLIMPFNL